MIMHIQLIHLISAREGAPLIQTCLQEHQRAEDDALLESWDHEVDASLQAAADRPPSPVWDSLDTAWILTALAAWLLLAMLIPTSEVTPASLKPEAEPSTSCC